MNDFAPVSDETGTVYLLHFSRPVGDTTRPWAYAQHYVGWAADLAGRVWHHAHGTSGASLVSAFHEAGIPFVVACSIPGTRADERRIKSYGGQTRYCPVCSQEPRIGPWHRRQQLCQ